LDEPPERFKRAPSRRNKTPPAKRVTISPEAAKAYEKLVQERDAKERDYVRHLGADNKPR
jgi:hypothetical protein